MQALNGSATEYSVSISDTHLARAHYIIRTPARCRRLTRWASSRTSPALCAAGATSCASS